MSVESVGQYGKLAANTFKQVAPSNRHQTTLRYTNQPFDSKENARKGLMDLFAYADSFATSGGTFTAQEIEAASGLDLSKLPEQKQIEGILDLNQDGKVALDEMVTGLGFLDMASDGKLDGVITEADRNVVELFFGGAAVQARMAKIQEEREKKWTQPLLDQVSGLAEEKAELREFVEAAIRSDQVTPEELQAMIQHASPKGIIASGIRSLENKLPDGGFKTFVIDALQSAFPYTLRNKEYIQFLKVLKPNTSLKEQFEAQQNAIANNEMTDMQQELQRQMRGAYQAAEMDTRVQEYRQARTA